MRTEHAKAWSEFRRMIAWIAVAGVLMVAGALWYLVDLRARSICRWIFATIGGVFVSTLLGCGLFAAAFFSDKSGHDRDVTDATRSSDDAD
jgi:hypothetical protein